MLVIKSIFKSDVSVFLDSFLKENNKHYFKTTWYEELYWNPSMSRQLWVWE